MTSPLPDPTDDTHESYSPSRAVAAGSPLGRYLMQVLWPAFLGAIAASGLFFSAVDPLDVDLVGIHLDGDRMSTYTIGFLAFWALFIGSGSLTYFMALTQAPQDD